GRRASERVAITDEGEVALDAPSRLSEEAMALLALTAEELAASTAHLRGGRARVALEGTAVVLVDDGFGTPLVLRAALRQLRRHGAASVTLAAPVMGSGVARALAREAQQLAWVAEVPSEIQV